MNCQEFEDRFHNLLDERKSPAHDPVLESHAQTCADCRELLVASDSLWTGLKAGRVAPPGREFADRVLADRVLADCSRAELARPQPRSAGFRLDGRWLSVALTAVAAMTLLMFSPAWYGGRIRGARPPVAVVEPRHVRPAATDNSDGWDDYKLMWDQLSVSLPQFEYEEVAPSTWALVAYAIDFFRRTFPEDHTRPANPNDNQPRGAMCLPRSAVWS